MDGLKAIVACVNFDDFLAITLPRNMKHFDDCLVVTDLDDERTELVVDSVPGARLFRTDAFTRSGKPFNRGFAIEEALDALGRSGWILHWDADILLPEVFEPELPDKNAIYAMTRRQLPEGVMDYGGDWSCWNFFPHGALFSGYFQLFHADAEALRSRPWYPTQFTDAGGSDVEYGTKFPRCIQLEGSVLHICPGWENWCGRVTPRLDGLPVPNADLNRIRMGRLFMQLGWRWARYDLQKLAWNHTRSKRGRPSTGSKH